MKLISFFFFFSTIFCGLTFAQTTKQVVNCPPELKHGEIINLIRNNNFQNISDYLKSKGGQLVDSTTKLFPELPYPKAEHRILRFCTENNNWIAAISTGGNYSYYIDLSILTSKKEVYNDYFNQMEFKCKQPDYPRYYLDIYKVPVDHKYKSVSIYFSAYPESTPTDFTITFTYNNGKD